MQRFIKFAAVLSLLAWSALTTPADDLAKLQGKWSVKKTSENGQAYTQVLEITKDKFKFRIVGADNQVQLYADGDLKLEKLGPFNLVKFVNIKAGASESDTQPIFDDRTFIYMLSENSWTVASNFDKEREGEKTSVDTYTKSTK